ncbi:MAG: hypothetical protein JO297_14835 [Nitrososphaeraceae archaeon]|nr:hypothetical protein [Nitrososphaeraceae archaeon]
MPDNEKRGVRIPSIIEPPTTTPLSTEWQTDDNTYIEAATLFDIVKFFLDL